MSQVTRCGYLLEHIFNSPYALFNVIVSGQGFWDHLIGKIRSQYETLSAEYVPAVQWKTNNYVCLLDLTMGVCAREVFSYLPDGWDELRCGVLPQFEQSIVYAQGIYPKPLRVALR